MIFDYDDIYCKNNKDAHNKGNYISDESNCSEDADEESAYLVISEDDVDYDGNDDVEECDYLVFTDDDIDDDGDDDSDACDHLVISYADIDDDDDSDACDYLVISDATMFFSPSTRLSRSLAAIQ